MLTENGGLMLRNFTDENFKEAFSQVAAGVWHVLGLGHSNAVFIEGDDSVILIDTLDTLERGQKLLAFIRKACGKEVRTIIYTHSHPDHRGGAGAFGESNPEIIAFAPSAQALEGTEVLKDVQSMRGARQFGYGLSDEENISQGIGLREGIAYGEHRAFVPPTTVYKEDSISRTIDGVLLKMTRLPGETEDQIAVWLPDKKVLCCGDNYYGCFPNLYAIRGGQYRDIAVWLNSLNALIAYPAEYLLPGHTKAICGCGEIKKVLTNFRNAISYILTETLAGMNQGKSIDELAAEIKLPSEYAELPYLSEHYGCTEWTVKSIYTAYLGWFDGNPTHLHPLPPREKSAKMIALAGGNQAVLQAAMDACKNGEYQWCLELCDLLLDSDSDNSKTKALKAEALKGIAEYETSANGRHYYITCAKELLS